MAVNMHMDALLDLPNVHSHHDPRGLRRLFDSVETHVRSLKALGVGPETYGTLLNSIMMKKLPTELRVIVNREFAEKSWEVGWMMEIIRRELEAREQALGASCSTYDNVPTQPKEVQVGEDFHPEDLPQPG